ncbi:MAG: 50S ribosomal protein L11 methyltransferase [Spirochaetota bacterium]
MKELEKILQRSLPGAKIAESSFPLCRELKLYLLDPSGMERGFSSGEAQNIFADTPFWAFCWASGYALASYILQNPGMVRGRRVVDFGAGSGVVAVAAAMAGADEAVACDLDSNALKAAILNAELNNVSITVSESIGKKAKRYDLLTAADVLYNTNNLFLLDMFLEHAQEVLLADSRVKDIEHPFYNKIYECRTSTLPRLGNSDDEIVGIYGTRPIFVNS